MVEQVRFATDKAKYDDWNEEPCGPAKQFVLSVREALDNNNVSKIIKDKLKVRQKLTYFSISSSHPSRRCGSSTSERSGAKMKKKDYNISWNLQVYYLAMLITSK